MEKDVFLKMTVYEFFPMAAYFLGPLANGCSCEGAVSSCVT